ncbi:MAG TPA: BTAD domain-containing putative transcriptional regulator [Streptosporangiaceae bacterium]|nr:BTAD domain-containing putative transcriptional regulator [Streptosporangiaceae bacterium]
MVQFRLLGPLEAQDGERRVDLGRPKQRALLAVLLVHANDVVSLDRLIEELWGEEPPPQAAASLQTYVSNLRRALEPGRPARAPSRVLVSQPPGYRLVVGAGDLDAARFAALAKEGHELLQARRPAAAARMLREGLALWRGPALAEVADEAFAQAERNRLEELRVAALEDRLAADLDLGGHAAAVAELEELAGRYPFREQLAAMLMLALYRSGRQGEALQALQAARRALADELGIDPGRRLRQLETAILRQDPGLDWAPPPEEPGPPPGDTGGSAGQASRALAASVTRSPQGAADGLVGRDGQLAALEGILAGARGGLGRVALVAGEPGIGKTRLAEEAARRAAAAGMQVAWGRCHEGDGAPAFWPWAQVVRQLAAELAPGQLAAMLGPSAAALGQLMPELAEPAPPAGPLPIADLGAARFQLNQAVAGLLRRLAEARPLLVVVDDLHWTDVPSLSLLAFLAAELNDARLAVVGTYRDVEVAPGRPLAETLGALAREPVVERIALGGLDRAGVARLIGRTIGGRPAEPLVEAVADRCGGNPFFITELLRLLQSERRLAAPDAAAAARHDIPVRVRDVLRRRLARLPAQTGTLLVIGAVAGREFDLDLIEAVTGLEDEPALDAAEAAVLAGLVIEDDRAAGRYRFAHALVRETIYEDISRARRARLHARVVDALAATRGPEPGPAAEMAYHCWHAAPVIGARRALPHLLRAGEQAVAQLAYEAADEQFERALELAAQLPASPQATEQEIHIAARLGTVRLVTRGYADPDAAQALARARSLAMRAGRRGEPADSRWALFVSHLVRSELGPALELGAELVELGSERNDPALLSAGHWQAGTVALYRGDLQEAQHHLEHALAASRDIAPDVPGDAPVEMTLVCQGYLGVARAHQGHADAALRLTGQAVASARRLGNPFGLLFVLFCDAWAATVAEQVTRALDSATEQAALIRKHGFRHWGIGPQFFQGWAEARTGDPRRGEQRIRAALAQMDATGTPGLRPLVLGLLAEAQLLAGHPTEAADTLRLATQEADRLGERLYDPQLSALQARLR